MSSQDQALPAIAPSEALDEAGAWFWQFLKTELAPYPGRAWVVGRMTIAATITMILVMTFRIPYGFLGAIYTLFLSRESPTVTLRGGIRVTVIYVIATIYTVVGVMTMVGSPITHFLWIASSLFLAFYLIHIMPDYFTAVGFGFLLAGAIPLWDETYLTVNQRTENTLWLGSSVVVGTAVTVAVEYIFRRVHPITELTQAHREQAAGGGGRPAANSRRPSSWRQAGKRDFPVFSAWHLEDAKAVAPLRLPTATYCADECRRRLAGAFD